MMAWIASGGGSPWLVLGCLTTMGLLVWLLVRLAGQSPATPALGREHHPIRPPADPRGVGGHTGRVRPAERGGGAGSGSVRP